MDNLQYVDDLDAIRCAEAGGDAALSILKRLRVMTERAAKEPGRLPFLYGTAVHCWIESHHLFSTAWERSIKVAELAAPKNPAAQRIAAWARALHAKMCEVRDLYPVALPWLLWWADHVRKTAPPNLWQFCMAELPPILGSSNAEVGESGSATMKTLLAIPSGKAALAETRAAIASFQSGARDIVDLSEAVQIFAGFAPSDSP